MKVNEHNYIVLNQMGLPLLSFYLHAFFWVVWKPQPPVMFHKFVIC